MQFNQGSIAPEAIDELVSENEKKERIQKALEIHMLENREAHMKPPGQTVFSFTQGDPNAVIGKVHGFGEAIGAFGEEKKQPSIEQQRQEQQKQQWQTEQKHQPTPVRTCPCCVRFLQDTFHMNEKEATTFTGGAESGPVTYGSGGSTGAYNMEASSGTYNGGGSDYSPGSGSGGGISYSGHSDSGGSQYSGNKKGYE